MFVCGCVLVVIGKCIESAQSSVDVLVYLWDPLGKGTKLHVLSDVDVGHDLCLSHTEYVGCNSVLLLFTCSCHLFSNF